MLVHGNPTWGFLWRRVIAELRARQSAAPPRRARSDRARVARASRARDAHTLVHHGEWLGDAIDAVAPGPLVLVAQDWGGAIGLRGHGGAPRAAARDRVRQHRGRAAGEGLQADAVPSALAAPGRRATLLFERLGFPLGVLHFSQGDRVEHSRRRRARVSLAASPSRGPRRTARARTYGARLARSSSVGARAPHDRGAVPRGEGADRARLGHEGSDPRSGRQSSGAAAARRDRHQDRAPDTFCRKKCRSSSRWRSRTSSAARTGRERDQDAVRGRGGRRRAAPRPDHSASRRRVVAAQGARGDRSRRRVRRSRARQGRGPTAARRSGRRGRDRRRARANR